jgi:hypothetical protein
MDTRASRILATMSTLTLMLESIKRLLDKFGGTDRPRAGDIIYLLDANVQHSHEITKSRSSKKKNSSRRSVWLRFRLRKSLSPFTQAWTEKQMFRLAPTFVVLVATLWMACVAIVESIKSILYFKILECRFRRSEPQPSYGFPKPSRWGRVLFVAGQSMDVCKHVESR